MQPVQRLFLIIHILLLSNVTFAGTNGILEGKVKDEGTGENIVGVTVQLVGTNLGATTDPEGYYQIHNIRSGVYDVRFSIIGYRTVLIKNVTIYVDLRSRVDVLLEQSAVEIGAVEIYSQRPLIQKDQPSTSFSIGEIKLEKLPISTFQEVLTLQPGVTLEGNVRGGKTNEVVYLIDGIPIEDYMGGGLGAELPKSSISGMTIYTGGFDAEYGNAMSGVVNVITRGGGNNHRLTLRFEKDNWLSTKVNKQVDQYNEAELSFSGPIVSDKLFYLSATSVKLHNTRWWQDMNNFFAPFNNRDVSGIVKIDYLLSQTTKVSLQGIYSFHDWRDYEYSWRYNLNGLPKRSRETLRGSFTLFQTLSDRSAYSISLTRYYLHNKIGEGAKQDIKLTPYQFDYYLRYIVQGKKNWWADAQQIVQSLKAEFSSQIDDSQLLKAGFEVNLYDISSDLVKYEPQRTYFGKTLENAPMLNFSNGYHYFPRTGSVFVQDKIRFDLDGSTLNVGVRWDFLDPRASRPLVEYIPISVTEFRQQIKGSAPASFKHRFSPRAAFAAPIGLNNMFFTNFGMYFQYPLFDYLYSGIGPAQIQSGAKNVLTGNPDLDPEVTTAWEIGYKHSWDEMYVGSVTYFKKNIKNQIDAKTLIPFDSKSAGDYGFAQYVNNAEADAEGIEFIISRERDDMFSGSISYTYMFAEGTSEVADQAINLSQWGFPIRVASFPLSWDQRHSLKLDVEKKLWFGILADIVLWYNSGKPYTYFPTKDGFTSIDTTKDFVPNNSRIPNTIFINMKLSKSFTLLNSTMPKITMYADVRNLFNTKNVKWIDSNGRIGGELYDPSAYYDLRRVRVGFTIDL